jgi:hypothetical protein
MTKKYQTYQCYLSRTSLDNHPEFLIYELSTLDECRCPFCEEILAEKVTTKISYIECIHCKQLYKRVNMTVKATGENEIIYHNTNDYIELAENGSDIVAGECNQCIWEIETKRAELEHETKQIDAMIKLGVIKENGLYTSTKIIYFCEAMCIVCFFVFAWIGNHHYEENAMFAVLGIIGYLAIFMLIPLGLIHQKDFNKHYNWRSNYRKYKKQQQQTEDKQNE